mmetsp:Transcript_22736/g.52112  ORF Transcript_22736/g.52112 Transcript_22736/m.52112 type:complete len:141 (+) Transcript_22736:322-744(+)
MFSGKPLINQVDEIIDFSWDSGFINQQIIGPASIRWTGFIQALYSEHINFEIDYEVFDDVKLWIEDILLINTPNNIQSGKYFVQENILYRAKIECTRNFYTNRDTSVRLIWYSRRIQRSKIPSKYLFNSVEQISGSPVII